MNNKELYKNTKVNKLMKNEQNKCPSCGSTDISLDEESGKLRCEFCKHIFKEEKYSRIKKRNEKGIIVSEGAKDIIDENDFVTLRCSSCGADIIIDTSEKLQAKCHWCRNVLSIKEKVPNGAVPDCMLPFIVKKEDAKKSIALLVSSKKKYINKKFIQQFNEGDIMGVYLPYMLVDVRLSVLMQGIGEKNEKKHEMLSFLLCASGDPEFYTVNVYDIKREFKMDIKELTIESKVDRVDDFYDRTNNIVNSILPFDTDKLVEWNPNYLKGYSAEKRDLNVDDLEKIMNNQSKDIIRMAMKKTIKEYDRGVRWKREKIMVHAQSWQTAYLPVWLYTYTDKHIWGNKTHYIAVNGRTGEIAGSVPMNMPLYVFKKVLPHIIAWGFFAWVKFYIVDEMSFIGASILSSVLIAFFQYILSIVLEENVEKYRSKHVRHDYENETKYTVKELKKDDRLKKVKKYRKDKPMKGANHTRIKGNRFGKVIK